VPTTAEGSVGGEGEVTIVAYFTAMLSEMDRRYQQRFEAQEKAVVAAIAAAEKAVLKAEMASEKRFESVNEFRQAYQDIISTMMPRTEAEQRMSALTEKINELREIVVSQQSHSSGIGDGGKYLVGFVGFILTVSLLWQLLF